MTTTVERPAATKRVASAAPKRPAPSARSIAASLVGLAFLGASVWALREIGINPAVLAKSVDNAGNFLTRMFPLDFPPLGETLSLVGETLAIVALSTLLAVLLSIPIALLSAESTSPHRAAQLTGRGLTVLCRATPDLVLAILFFRVFGLGAAAGILAMGILSLIHI